MNLHCCRFCGLKFETGGHCERRQDLRTTSGFGKTLPHPKDQIRGASFPRRGSWEELDPDIENLTPELVADRKSCMEPEDFAAFIDRMAEKVKKAFQY